MNKDIVYLEYILLSDDVISSINDNLDYLLEIIPEIGDMIGFLHNHPHHHLDVWNHTLLAVSLSSNDFIVRLSLLFHDIGKPHSYQDGEVRHFYNHPKVSADITKDILNRIGFNDRIINDICYIVENHDTAINDELINSNYLLALKLFEVQRCDVLAHNPKKLGKRINYLDKTLKKFRKLEKS